MNGYDNQFENESKRQFLRGIGVPKQATFVADEFQLSAINSLASGNDTLVVAPTGAGKTYIATKAIERVIAGGQRAIYTAPLKALSNSKYTEFRKVFEPQYSVGLLTGDRKIEGDASIVVATTEIYRNELFSYRENYALVVLDELHYLADSQRGPVWEESIILAPRSATLLMLSASISNPYEIAEWIQEVRGRPVEVVTMAKRPVELRLGFLHPRQGVIPLSDAHGQLNREVQNFYQRREDRPDFEPRRGGGRGRGRR